MHGTNVKKRKKKKRFGTFILNKRNQFKNHKVRWESYITMDPEQIGMG